MTDPSTTTTVITTSVGALSAILGAAVSNWFAVRRERENRAFQRITDQEKRVFESAERRFDARVNASRALLAELRTCLYRASDFEDQHGISPVDIHDHIELREAWTRLAEVEMLGPKELAHAASNATQATSAYLNATSKTYPNEAIQEFVNTARRCLGETRI